MEKKDNKSNEQNLYSRNVLELKVILLSQEIGENKTNKNLKQKVVNQIEGKCIQEGFVKPNSVQLLKYSAGLVKTQYIEFSVVIECKTCNPTEGLLLYDCVCTSVTKGGIHANIYDNQNNIPVTVYIHRDHFAENRVFQSIQKDDIFDIKVIGARFELNDPCVEIIGEIWGKKK
jgi:hypothetical protein